MKLTKSVIDRAVYEGSEVASNNRTSTWSRCVLWDDDVRGLGLRITHASKKSSSTRWVRMES